MRIPNPEHASRPWRIQDVAPDFRLEDAWQLPVTGGPDDFPELVEALVGLDPAQSSVAVRTLLAVRMLLGRVFGWDKAPSGGGSKAPTLADRLPEDLRDGPTGPQVDNLPFRSLYLVEDEWAAETANKTMHGVLQLGWVPDGAGGYRGRLAVYVKPNGTFGRTYMAAIKPFRYLVVYPRLLKAIGRAWDARSSARQEA